MRYRHRLGLYLKGAELNTDPTFKTACGAGTWVCENGTSGSVTSDYLGGGGGQLFFTHTNDAVNYTGCTATISGVANMFTAGKKYRITVSINTTAVEFGNYTLNAGLPYVTNYYTDYLNVSLEIFVGNFSTSKSIYFLKDGDNNITWSFDLYAVETAPLIIRASSQGIPGLIATTYTNTILINSVSVKEYEWNNPITFDPAVNNYYNIEVSELFTQSIVGYNDSVIYYDDGYTYLAARMPNDIVPVKIEYYSGGGWATFMEGTIYTNECEFTRESVKCNIENVFSQVVRKGNEGKFRISSNIDNLYTMRSYTDPSAIAIEHHNPITGAWSGADDFYMYNSWKALRDIIHEYSDNRVSLYSAEYYTGLDAWYQNIALSTGYGIDAANHYGTLISYVWTDYNFLEYSFKELFDFHNALFNVAFYEYKTATNYYMRIEPKNTLRAISTLTFNGVNNIEWQFNNECMYGAINAGFKEEWFLNYDATNNYTASNGLDEKTLELTRSEIRNSILIYNAFNAPSSDTKTRIYISEYTVATKRTINFGSIYDQSIFVNITEAYNGDIIGTANINRWANNIYFDYTTNDYAYPITGLETQYKTYEFQMYLSFSNIQSLITNPYSRIVLATSYHNTTGNIISVSWNIKTEIATIKLFGT